MNVITNDRYRWVPQNRWDLVAPTDLESAIGSVAIIVPYFEQPESLGRMYATLAVAPLDPDRHELIVVDDGSRDPPPLPPGAFPLPTRILHQADDGCRPGAARNLGVANTDAELLVFLDSDTLPESNTVTLLAAWPDALPDSLVVGRRHHADLAGWTPAATQAWLSGTGAPPQRGEDPAWLERGYRESGNLLNVDDRSYRYVISAVMACHRSLYDDIGGFDAERDEYGGDDWEFASRAFNNGAVLIHEPCAIAWHDEADWAGRDGRLTVNNRQTMYLASAVGEPLTRGPGLIQRHPDTIACVDLQPDATDGQVVATIQCLLAGLTDIGVHLPSRLPDTVRRHTAHDPRVHFEPPTTETLRRCRTVIHLDGPAYWDPDRLRTCVGDLRADDVGLITVAHSGVRLATIASTRALGRVRRAAKHGIDEIAAMSELFGHHDQTAEEAGIHRLDRDVDLAGYFGGWVTP